MAGRTGTLALADLLSQTYVSAEAFGLSTIQQVIQADIDAHNGIVQTDFFRNLVARTTDAQRVFGGSTAGKMMAVNEFGRAPTQKAGAGSTVGFPLEKYQYNIGWTQEWFRRNTPADMAQQTMNAEVAHLLEIERQVKRAMFGSANYSYVDIYNKGITLGVKRFVNGDGSPIPSGPNGETFNASTHTHYLASATLTNAAVLSLVQTVLEHRAGARVQLSVSATDEAAFRALTSFSAAVDMNYTLNASANQVIQRMDPTLTNNRFIGRFGGAEVWVRSWALPNYIAAADVDAPMKPLALREYADGESALRIVAEFNSHPLHAQFMESEFGVGVWNRVGGAVLYTASGTYADPVIA